MTRSILLVLAFVISAATGAVISPTEHAARANVQQRRSQAPFQASNATTAPTDDGSSPGRKAEMAALLNKYAPMFKLASDERYFPSSVKYMLDRYSFIETRNGTTFRPDRSTFTLEHLGDLAHSGKNQSLSLDELHNGQPLMEPAGEFLYGPAGQDGALEPGPDGRGRVHDEVYGFWVDQGRGVVDLFYWTFYPYNLGKLVGTLGWLGNHVTDWERLRLRTVNGTAESADFNTHSGGAFSAGTLLWDEVERTPDDRPIAYIASGSHGVWPKPGRHVYAQLLNLWSLIDMADDQGPIWDTRNHVVPIEYWTGPTKARKIVHDGDQNWLQFKGNWGNQEPETCWWHFFVGICQLIDGPPGPNRRFGYPPDCIIGTSAEETSTYTFYLTQATVTQARRLGVTRIELEQVCARPTSGLDTAQMAGNWSYTLPESELDVWSLMSPEIPFDPNTATQYAATVPACEGTRSAAKAYRLALRNADGDRVSTSPLRTICIHTPGSRGWKNAPAADVRDVDEWRWNLTKKASQLLVPRQRR